MLLKSGVPGVVLIQVLALGGLGLSAGSPFLGGLDGAFAYVSYVLVGVCLISLLTPAVLWELPTLLARGKVTRWTRYAPRNTLGAAGLLFLLWTLVLAPFDSVRQAMQPNELAFIALGLFQVLAGVMVLTSIAPLAVQWLSKQRLFSRRLGPSGAVALAHPLAHPVRTAVVMGMFSITMFSVVVLAGYTEQFETYSGDFVEEAEGEFELLLTSTRSRPIELGDDPSSWGINHSSVENIDAVGRTVHRSILKTPMANACPTFFEASTKVLCFTEGCRFMFGMTPSVQPHRRLGCRFHSSKMWCSSMHRSAWNRRRMEPV